MKTTVCLQLTALAFTASFSTALAQTLLWSDDFSNPSGWSVAGCQTSYANQQLVLSQSYGPTPTNNPMGTYGFAWHGIPVSGPLLDGQTLEARVDVIRANQAELWADVAFFSPGGSDYHLFMDEDEVGLLKGSGSKFCIFFWTNSLIKNQNVTLVLSLTRLAQNLRIRTVILDKDNANAVLFEHTVADTPQQDPAVPSGTVKGLVSYPDSAGIPSPTISAPASVLLGLPWTNPSSPTQGDAQLIYDNLKVWAYESPDLAIQNAVVLSWPATSVGFVLECTSDAEYGPWEAVSDPWIRTNAAQVQVSIPASAPCMFYRLRFSP